MIHRPIAIRGAPGARPLISACRPLLVAALLAAATIFGCAGDGGDRGSRLSGRTMGTYYAVLIAGAPAADVDALDTSIRDRLDGLDALLSTYRPDSEVVRFNSRPGTDWFDVSPETLEIVRHALSVSVVTDGAFDITVGPLVDLWGFGPEEPPVTIPPQSAIDARLATTGYRYLQIRETPAAIRRTVPGIRIDLSAIAKGHAVDAVAKLLDDRGVINYMVDIGGEIRTRGLSADGDAWQIAVEHPGAGADASPVVLALTDAAVATSGDYRNYFEYQGRRYSHAIDPHTGWPVDNGVAAATVIASSVMRADALATAMMVLGPEAGLALAEREAIAALLQIRTDAGIRISTSTAFDRFVEQHE